MKVKVLAVLAVKVYKVIEAIKDIASIAKSVGPCDPIIDDTRPAEVAKEASSIKIQNAGKFGSHERRESNRR